MKKIISVMFVLLLTLTSCSQDRSNLEVGVIQFGDFASLNDTLEGLETVLETTDIHYTVKSAQGDAANVVGIATQFVDDQVDLIVAITTQAAQAAVAASDGLIPVIFVAVSDPASAGITGLNYVTGVSDIAPLDAQFDLITQLTPNVKKVGVLYKTGDPNGVFQTDRIIEKGREKGFEVISKGAIEVSDLSIVTVQLAQEVDALYLITDGLIVGNTAVIVDEANRQGVVSYASEDGQFEQGVLATNSISYVAIGKQAGEMVKKVLLDNVKIHEIPIEEAGITKPKISQEIALNFNIDIPDDLLEYTE